MVAPLVDHGDHNGRVDVGIIGCGDGGSVRLLL